jgi:hypothetical protein
VCKQLKTVDNFHTRKTAKGTLYFYSNCKQCKIESAKKWYRENREKKLKYNKNLSAEYKKDGQLKTKYGINYNIFTNMLESQNYKCQICETELKQGKISNGGNCAVDHCHKTFAVRGLLCNNCNLGLGHFMDDIDLMQKAIKYLKDWGVQAA